MASETTEGQIRDKFAEDRREAFVRRQAPVLADAQTYVVAGQVAHRERAHGETEVFDDAVDLFGRRTVLSPKG